MRSANQLGLLSKAARRFIVSQLDCIAYSNPSYARSFEEWVNYRLVTQTAFAAADGIVFNSNDVAHDSAHRGLHIPSERTCVSYNGVDHHLHKADAVPPDKADELSARPFLIVLGTNFKHKNRVQALRILQVLITKHHWPGQLVFAGPKVNYGGSEADEAQELRENPELRPRVHDLGPVSEGQKKWLLENAALLLSPSAYEGFGLVPFEAAAVGTPALTTRATSLGEVLGDEVVFLDELDAARGAELAWSLLSNPELANKQVEAIKTRAAFFTWQMVAERTWELYQRILAMPLRTPALRTWSHEREAPSTWKQPEKSWPARVERAFQILRTKGPRALLQEIRQFIHWMRA
jgi:glycosyltransferase involved in cell wall biosynthesis